MAFIGAVEMVMQPVRRARAPRAAATVPAPAPVPPVPGDVAGAVLAAYATSVAAGTPLSQRAIAARFGISRRKASQLITQASSPMAGTETAA